MLTVTDGSTSCAVVIYRFKKLVVSRFFFFLAGEKKSPDPRLSLRTFRFCLKNIIFCCRERFHSRDQHLCKFMGTKGIVFIRKEINSQRTCLGHQHGHDGRRFIVLEHQHGRRDVMCQRSISRFPSQYIL